ncbi:MAG: hypothetical protein HYU67_06070 [Flavobacteriia bacterium]|nr:hypothetical protein [Flavobacteriia bacterium]
MPFFCHRYWLLFFSLIFAFQYHAQIISNNSTVKTKKSKKLLSVKDSSDVSFFIEYSPGLSFRKLYPNDDFISKPLGIKENEKFLFTHSFSLGIEHLIAPKLFLRIGLSGVNFGEKYSNNSNDSIVKYSNHYRTIGIPLHLGFKSKGKVSFSFSAGFQALFLVHFIQKYSLEWNGIKESNKLKQDKDRKQTLLAVNADVRCSFPINKLFNGYLGLGFTKQLTNSYNKQADYKHYSCLFNLRGGILYPL